MKKAFVYIGSRFWCKRLKKNYPCTRSNNVMCRRRDIFTTYDKSNFFIRFRRSNLKELDRPIFPPVEQIASTLEQFLSLLVSFIPVYLITAMVTSNSLLIPPIACTLSGITSQNYLFIMKCYTIFTSLFSCFIGVIILNIHRDNWSAQSFGFSEFMNSS